MVIVGQPPSKVTLFDGKTGKLSSELGKVRRNTLKWNPFGRFVAVGGFGTLAGDLDVFDRSREETISNFRAELTVVCTWAPDGRHFLSSTVAPRMNEGNQISIYKYTGERKLKMEFKPDHVEGRHEDTGGGARTKTQALLFMASWRPDGSKKHEDRAASPPRAGTRRKKGLEDTNQVAAKAAGAAYRPRGAIGEAGGSVAAMMRGDVDIPAVEARTNGDKWDYKETPKLEDWEIRKMEKEAKKAAEQKAKEEEEKVKQAIRDIEQGEKNAKKRLKEVKKLLEELEKLKDKEWDELTDEDEAALEGEIGLREELAELEKKTLD